MTNHLNVLLLFLISAPCLNSQPLVKTENGILVGTVEKSRSGRNYSAFLGVPYGKPPVGDLRFKNPVPAEKWTGLRKANSFGNSCLHTFFGVTFGKEDCLFLNIYSPFLKFQQANISSSNRTLLPVMVYIHGGAFFFGAGNDYKANYILDKNVIFVTINYRLGIFGFLSTADIVAPGNFGLKDQLLALKWIQRNIEFFGGDCNRVTLFGLSAGSVSVHLHTINQQSSGLFHQYIMESGNAITSFAYRDRNEIFKSVKKMAQFAMCPTTNTQILIDCLRKVDGHYLLFVSNLVGLIIRMAEFPWQPTNEPMNDDAFLTENPQNLIHQMKDAPFICGVAGNEAAIVTNYFYTFDLLYTRLKKHMKKLFIDDAVYMRDAKKNFPNELYKFYFNNSQHLTKKQFLDTYTNLASDGIFNYPAIRMLDQIGPKMKSPIYFYRYMYRGKNSILSNILSDENFGAGHGGEVVYLFPIQYFFINRTDADLTDNDRMMSKITVDLWTSFAINGKPTSNYLDPPNLWKPYSTKNNHNLLIGDENDNLKPSVKLSSNFLSNRMNFWRNNFPN